MIYMARSSKIKDDTLYWKGEDGLRICCSFCGKSVSTEIRDKNFILRAISICPECIGLKKILIPDYETQIIRTISVATIDPSLTKE